MSDIQTLEDEYEAAKSNMTRKRALVTRAERTIKKGGKVDNIKQLKENYESAKTDMTKKRALLTRAKRALKKKKTSPRVSPKTVVSPRNISNKGFDSLSPTEKNIFIKHMETKEAVLSPKDSKYRYGGREVNPYVYQPNDLVYGLELLRGDIAKKN